GARRSGPHPELEQWIGVGADIRGCDHAVRTTADRDLVRICGDGWNLATRLYYGHGERGVRVECRGRACGVLGPDTEIRAGRAGPQESGCRRVRLDDLPRARGSGSHPELVERVRAAGRGRGESDRGAGRNRWR